MVCSGKFDVLTPLVQCLNGSGDELHLALLALNNLSIPTENKRVMSLGPSSKDIIGGLCKTIAKNIHNSYLACICLMNISFFEASRQIMLQHSPSPDDREIPPLENPNSLLRVLEKLLLAYSLKEELATADEQVRSADEQVRWACNLLKNLSKASKEAATLIGQTEIPKCVVEYIRDSAPSVSSWKNNHLGDGCLFIVLHLAEWPESRDALTRADAIGVIKPILVTARGDIQGLIATMACAFLDGDDAHTWCTSPIGRKTAEEAVAELVTNMQTKKGKDGQYKYEDFNLNMATKAYDIIMPSTNIAGREVAHVQDL
mmetsp:Transcript_7699/g.8969  ORF Transcript_7699/g.8969 Transcript_7699/m.8969 type:complete len:316 (+) Transcript_7699:391-1338(+)